MHQRKCNAGGPVADPEPESTREKLFSLFMGKEMYSEVNNSWRKEYDNMVKQGYPEKCAKCLMRILFLFQTTTQTYVLLQYIVPYIFVDYSSWTIYYWKVAVYFVVINGYANWLCVVLYDTSYRKSKDNPYLQVNWSYDNPPDQFRALIEQASNNQNGHCMYDMSSKEALPWNFCEDCKMQVPPRAHHCKYCKKCILKRDHHCFMVGNCIGFKNQRYFIVLAFYAMTTGAVGGFFTCKYVREVVWPLLGSWLDLFLPITLWKWIFGNIMGLQCLLIFHSYMEFIFGFLGFVYFSSQMTISADGKTLFEVAKKIPIRNTNTVNQNLKSVFGDFWLLNFLFPMTLVFRQRDDGVHWDGIKIDHDANEQWKDNGEIL